jgi:hypothetical protein
MNSPFPETTRSLINTGLQPGVQRRATSEPFQRFSAQGDKPLKRFFARTDSVTGLKPGVNETISPTNPFRILPVPPLAGQRALVAELATERAPVPANRELAVRSGQKLQTKLSAIWGTEAAK